MQSVIEFHNVSYVLATGRRLFDGLSFSVDAGLTALVGPNGVGKTTLGLLAMGKISPAEGRVRRRGDVVMLSQREPPGNESIETYLGDDYAFPTLGERLIAGLDRSKKCDELSGGQWMRLRLAKVAGRGFLILDEPTNDLDRSGRDAVLEFLRECSQGALLISHDRQCLRLCGQTLELSNQGLSKFGGGWESYEKAREIERGNLSEALDRAKRQRDDAQTIRQEKLRQQEKRNKAGDQKARRGGIPKILAGRNKRRAQATTSRLDAQTLQKATEKVATAFEAYQRLKVDPVMYVNISGEALHSQALLVEARGFNVHYDHWVFKRDLDFAWRGNMRLAIKGGNGTGKTTLIKAILGTELATRGELRRGKARTLYLDQRCAGLIDEKSVYDNVAMASRLPESELRGELAKFLFVEEGVFQPVKTLSGGERLRAALARGLLGKQRPEMLILDEPTNNLDLLNVRFLERLLREFKGAILAVSHDEDFLKESKIEDELVLD